MEYYRITQKKNIRNIILPKFPSSTEIWHRTEPMFVPGKAAETEGELSFLPLYEGNAFLICGPMQAVWKMYQKGGRYRPCAFGSVEQRKVLPYCFTVPRILECIHPDTVYYKNDTIKELVLDRESIGAHKVFGIRTLHSIRLILSGDVLEELLRKNITCFQWEEVIAR